MKKLFFTAITLVAFSSASMANTIAEKQDDTIEIKKSETSVTKEENKKVNMDCGGVWSVTRFYALQAGLPTQVANCMALSAYIKCIGAAEDAYLDRGVLC
ncbi:hypothetical protein [Flavobacterium sp.]|uniref:hypothetical protein n=1 Tax=Flavobacterium sp. TaxID=239 RepID=UPI003752357C